MGRSMSFSDSPVLPTNAKYKARYSFTWTINSLAWTAHCGTYVDSPDFSTAEGGKWTIRLYPFGVNYFCSLLRMYDSAPLVLHYDVDFLPKIGDGPPSYSVQAEPFSIGHLLHIPLEVISSDSAKSDLLVLQFRLKKCRRKGPRGLFVVSEIQVGRSRAEYSCSFKEPARTSLMADNEARNIMEEDHNFVNGSFFNLEEKAGEKIFPMQMYCSPFGYTVLALNISRTKYVVKSRIHLLDIKGNIYVSSEIGEHFFRNQLIDLFKYHKMMTPEQMETNKNVIFRDGQLDFIFDIETSNGKITTKSCKWICYEPSRKSQNSLQDDMKKFFNALRKTDLQYRIGEQVFQTHRAIVSARSPVFHTMLKLDMLEKETGVVAIEGIDPDTFKRFMCFIYTATFYDDMDCEDIVKLYSAADRYSVISLKRICSSILNSYIQLDNCSWLLIFSDLHQDHKLKDAIEFFILTRYEDIIYSDDWKFMEEKYPQIAKYVLEKQLQRSQKFKIIEDE